MVASYIAAAGSLLAVLVSYLNHKRIAEVHVLVNNQLDAVMDKLIERTAERDQLLKDKETD